MSKEAKVISLISVIVGILIVGSAFLLGDKSANVVAAGQLIRDDNYKISSDSAQLTLVEFADFQCPACGSTHPVLQKLLKDYEGKVTFVYRNFPLPMHQNAMAAAQAAEAAGKQGKFWEMHDKIFETQGSWSLTPNASEIFTNYAKDLSLDVDKFKTDLNSEEVINKIRRDSQDGQALGVSGTPTFFFNNERYNGSLNYDSLKNKIHSFLK